MASILIPKEGMAQEWRTSAAVTRIRIWVLKGKIVWLLTSKRRKSDVKISEDGIIKESNSILRKSEYSYLQYHWWPTVFKVIEGNFVSSSK